MAGASFKTNPYELEELLRDCHKGELQLPDFQRSWVWDEDRIKSLIASVSRSFPVGALMTLETGGPVDFRPRPIEGTPDAAGTARPRALILDGQQRMTSLYQATLRGQVIETLTARGKSVKRWFYVDIRKALDPSISRDDAIIGVPEDRIIREDFGRVVRLDVSTPEREQAELLFPMTQIFDWDDWQDEFYSYWRKSAPENIDLFKLFKKEVLQAFKAYQVPVITLDRDTTKEAVCVVFEKVNTGGKPLDAFELVTAMYAADGFELRKDWFGGDGKPGRARRLAETLRPPEAEAGILESVASTDFLTAVSLFHTRDLRRKAEADGKSGKELPAISGNRRALLDVPLSAYKDYADVVQTGFVRAAKFLYQQHIYRVVDLPYQSQIVPLAAILADIGDAWEYETNRRRIAEWYWCGVFGELYGSAVDTRFARDFIEVPAWLAGGSTPTTVHDATLRADRLLTMRSRVSAAYKGVNALLMRAGAADFRSGQKFDHTVFFGESVDIHHIFPKDWCKKKKIPASRFDSIINKTPLSLATNRVIGSVAPSVYLGKLEKGSDKVPPIGTSTLEAVLGTHLIAADYLRQDDFEGFLRDRQARLLSLMEQAMGKKAYRGAGADEAEQDILEPEVAADDLSAEADAA